MREKKKLYESHNFSIVYYLYIVNCVVYNNNYSKFSNEFSKHVKEEIKREIRQLMIGGMGSFNDLVLPDNEADKKLKNLRKELFELSI